MSSHVIIENIGADRMTSMTKHMVMSPPSMSSEKKVNVQKCSSRRHKRDIIVTFIGCVFL